MLPIKARTPDSGTLVVATACWLKDTLLMPMFQLNHLIVNFGAVKFTGSVMTELESNKMESKVPPVEL